MRGWPAILANWCRLPLRGAFADLDLQIDKLRMLRDSYHTPLHSLHDNDADLKNDEKNDENLLLVL